MPGNVDMQCRMQIFKLCQPLRLSLLLVCFLFVFGASHAARTFTNTEGERVTGEIEKTAFKKYGKKVYIRATNGKQVSGYYDYFTKRDQAYIDAWERENSEKSNIPRSAGNSSVNTTNPSTGTPQTAPAVVTPDEDDEETSDFSSLDEAPDLEALQGVDPSVFGAGPGDRNSSNRSNAPWWNFAERKISPYAMIGVGVVLWLIGLVVGSLIYGFFIYISAKIARLEHPVYFMQCVSAIIVIFLVGIIPWSIIAVIMILFAKTHLVLSFILYAMIMIIYNCWIIKYWSDVLRCSVWKVIIIHIIAMFIYTLFSIVVSVIPVLLISLF